MVASFITEDQQMPVTMFVSAYAYLVYRNMITDYRAPRELVNECATFYELAKLLNIPSLIGCTYEAYIIEYIKRQACKKGNFQLCIV